MSSPLNEKSTEAKHRGGAQGRSTGAEQLVVVMKRLKNRGAKELRHSAGFVDQPARGGVYEFGKSFFKAG